MQRNNTMNKRDEVLKELKPIADILGIQIDYHEKDENNKHEYLVCNNQKICTSATSIYGIREEFFGYVTTRELKHRLNDKTLKHIKQYWFDDNFNQPFFRGF